MSLICIFIQVLRTVAPLVETLGADACDQHFIPEVLKMAQDVQWRVRLAGAVM